GGNRAAPVGCGDKRKAATPMTLNHLFDLSFSGRRHEAALECQGHTFTFGEVDARANRMANALASRRFVAGDRLCVQLPNSIAMLDLYLACVRLGVIFVPVNILYKEREVGPILKDAEPRMFVTSGNVDELCAGGEQARAGRTAVVLDSDSPAGIIYTSGTTGVSKGAVLTHNNFAANATNLLACWQITSTDRLLLALPLFH